MSKIMWKDCIICMKMRNFAIKPTEFYGKDDSHSGR